MTARAKKGEGPRTEYLVLHRVLGSGWEPWGTVETSSAATAVRAWITEVGVDRTDERVHQVVAVPLRSWQPAEVSIQRTEKLVVKPASRIYDPSSEEASPEAPADPPDINPDDIPF